MCGDHENLIDKKSGVRFPVDILQSWKALHEYRISYEHTGKQAAFGFVRSLKLARSPMFLPDSRIDFAKTTFLIGPNGGGKSAVCEWLTVLDGGENARRWLNNDNLRYTITFDAPSEHRLHVQTGGLLTLELDGKAVARNYVRSSAVYLRGRGKENISCDMQRINQLLRIDESVLRSLVGRISGQFVGKLELVKRVKDDAQTEPEFDLRCHLSDGSVMDFGQLSGGEQGRVLLELAMALAREAALFGPTMLIVELKSLGMDWMATEPYLFHFSSSQCLYQTVLTSWELPDNAKMLGWQIYEINGERGEVGTIAASPRV